MDQLNQSINNLLSVLWLIPRAFGVWFLIMGIRDLSTGLHDHQNMQAIKGIGELLGGVILLFAKEILGWIAPGANLG